MTKATKDGTTIPGIDPLHSEKINEAKVTTLGPERADGSENVQGSGLTPDGEDDGTVPDTSGSAESD